MKECPNCHYVDLNTSDFCVKCGAKLIERASTQDSNIGNTPVDRFLASGGIISKEDCSYTKCVFSTATKFFLGVISIFLPVLGFFFGLLISLTSYPDKKDIAEQCLKWSSIAFIVHFILGFIVGFISAVS